MVQDLTKALFTPISFASVAARNRIVMAPMVTNFAGPKDEVTDRQVAYYAERAKGGAGTIMIEASSIRHDAGISSRQIGAYDDRFIPGLSQLASAIKSQGALAILQLVHGGPKAWSAHGAPGESASPVSIRVGEIPRQLTAAELRQVRRDFVAAASRAKKAGFDGIELHAAHLYLLSAFLSPYANKRTDDYGGSVAHRARLTRETVEEIKTELGADWPVWVRINACEALEPGLSLEEGQEASKILCQAGADAIHASAYTLPINKRITGMVQIRVGAIPGKTTPPGPLLPYAAAIKKEVDVPVIAVGKLDDPLLAARAVRDGMCDLVALARQLLCDPYWVSKVKDGRPEEIVHCNYCNACHTAQQRGIDLRCARNLNLFGKPVYKDLPRTRRSRAPAN